MGTKAGFDKVTEISHEVRQRSWVDQGFEEAEL